MKKEPNTVALYLAAQTFLYLQVSFKIIIIVNQYKFQNQYVNLAIWSELKSIE